MVSNGRGPSIGIRASTLSVKELRRDQRREAFEPVTVDTAELDELERARPRTRADCEKNGLRPCPFASCRHNLFLDVTGVGSIKLNHPGVSPEDMATSCALDVADVGGVTLEEVGKALNLTRERVRQIEALAIRKVRLGGVEGFGEE